MNSISSCDLHIHSYYSDGAMSPEAIVRAAAAAGLSAVSISDHDTAAGQPEAIEAGVAAGVEIVTGIEFSVKEGELDIHILAYCVSLGNERLSTVLLDLEKGRTLRAEKIAGKLQDLGVPVSFEEIMDDAGAGTVGRPQLIVKGSKIYFDGKGFQWLSLCIENPTVLPIPNCYGKLCKRRHVRLGLTKSNGEFIRPELSLEAGSHSREHMELPPEGHRFIWLPENLAEITITIPGYNGQEYLYFAAKNKDATAFGFPTEMGIKYDNWSSGDFELEIEIGSESSGFQPIKSVVVFRTEGGDLEPISPKVID